MFRVEQGTAWKDPKCDTCHIQIRDIYHFIKQNGAIIMAANIKEQTKCKNDQTDNIKVVNSCNGQN